MFHGLIIVNLVNQTLRINEYNIIDIQEQNCSFKTKLRTEKKKILLVISNYMYVAKKKNLYVCGCVYDVQWESN